MASNLDARVLLYQPGTEEPTPGDAISSKPSGSTVSPAGDLENNILPMPPSGKKPMRRRKKCAICCSITAVAGLAAGAIGLFVIGPLIAKTAMANSVINFDTLDMDCVVANQSIMVASEISISHVGPLGCSIGAMNVTVMYKDHAFGILQMPPMSVEAGKDNHRSVSSRPLTITDVKTWNEVSTELLKSKAVSWRLKADASVTAGAMGAHYTFNGVPFDKQVSIRGFNAFASDMKVLGLDVVGERDGTLLMVAQAEVTNPSNIAMSMGPLSLELWTALPGSEQVKLGDMHIEDFAIKANSQGTAVTRFPKVMATVTKSSLSAAGGRAFLSNFVQGTAQTVNIHGTADGTQMKLMKASIAGFKTTSSVPGLVKHRLLQRSLMHIPWPTHPLELPTQLAVQNPFTADMVFHESHCDIYPCKKFNDAHQCEEYYTESVGFYTQDTLNEKVAGKTAMALNLHPVKLYKLITPENIRTVLGAAGRGSLINLKGNMTVSVGSTRMSLDYQEKDVPICLVYPTHECEDFMKDYPTIRPRVN